MLSPTSRLYLHLIFQSFHTNHLFLAVLIHVPGFKTNTFQPSFIYISKPYMFFIFSAGPYFFLLSRTVHFKPYKESAHLKPVQLILYIRSLFYLHLTRKCGPSFSITFNGGIKKKYIHICSDIKPAHKYMVERNVWESVF